MQTLPPGSIKQWATRHIRPAITTSEQRITYQFLAATLLALLEEQPPPLLLLNNSRRTMDNGMREEAG
jgi:hypothetical protein